MSEAFKGLSKDAKAQTAATLAAARVSMQDFSNLSEDRCNEYLKNYYESIYNLFEEADNE